MKYSVIDISSSSISMIAAEAEGGAAEILFKDRASLALPHYMNGNALSPRGIDKLAEAVSVMKGKCARLGADALYLIYTAALRFVENFEEVRAALLERTGLPVNLIDGSTEAYCDHIANRAYRSCDKAVLVDIGGSSMEICGLSADGRDPMLCLNFGIFGLHKKFVRKIQPNEEEAKSIRRFIGKKFDAAKVPQKQFKTMVMVGATSLALYEVYAEFTGEAPENGVREMRWKKFKKLVKRLLSGADRSKLILEAAPEKLYSVGIAAIVAKSLFKRFGAEKLVVSDRGVKEGYLELVLSGKIEAAYYDFAKGGSFEVVRTAAAEGKGKADKPKKKTSPARRKAAAKRVSAPSSEGAEAKKRTAQGSRRKGERAAEGAKKKVSAIGEKKEKEERKES